MLARAAAAQGLGRRDSVLDLCTGSGVVAVACALAGAGEVTAIDVSRRAVLTVRLNARRNSVRVRALRGDLFGPVAGRRFDLITANPPYLPSTDDRLPRRGAERAWEAGHDGRALLDRICPRAPAHLRAGGQMLLVHSSVCGIDRTLSQLEAGGLEAEVIERIRGPLGPLLRNRAPRLERRGLLAPGAQEEVVVVRAVKPVKDATGGDALAAAGRSAGR